MPGANSLNELNSRWCRGQKKTKQSIYL